MGPLALTYGAATVAIAIFGWRSRCRDLGKVGVVMVISWFLSNDANHLYSLEIVGSWVVIDGFVFSCVLMLNGFRPTRWKAALLVLIGLQDIAHFSQLFIGGEHTLNIYRWMINALYVLQLVTMVTAMLMPGLDADCGSGPRMRYRKRGNRVIQLGSA